MTMRPQFGQTVPSTVVPTDDVAGAAGCAGQTWESIPPAEAAGAGVGATPMNPEADALAAAVPAAEAPPFCMVGPPAAGIFGESFHGIPPFCFAAAGVAAAATLVGSGVGSFPGTCP